MSTGRQPIAQYGQHDDKTCECRSDLFNLALDCLLPGDMSIECILDRIETPEEAGIAEPKKPR